MSNWFAATARSNKSTTFGNISFATFNDKLKCIGFFGDILRPGSPVDAAHNYDINVNYNAVGLDVIDEDGVHRTIGGNDAYGMELQYSFYLSLDNLIYLANGHQLKVDDAAKVEKNDYIAPITEKWLKNWYKDLLLTFDLYRLNTRSLNIYKNAEWLTNMLNQLPSHNVAMVVSHMLSCLRRNNGFANVQNALNPYVERVLPNFSYKKGDTYYVLPAEVLNNPHLYGACVRGFIFKTYYLRRGYIYYADTSDANEFVSADLHVNATASSSEFYTDREDKLVTVLAGVVYDTVESRCNVLMNHSAYNRVSYVGLPYIRISEGGADEASYYCIARNVYNNTLRRNANGPLVCEIDGGGGNSQLTFLEDSMTHARSWLLGSSRSLVDSVLTTVFNAAAGATLSGGLSADVVALLARHNTADVICAYTPVTNDPIMTQLTPGHFCGTVLYEMIARGTPNNMYITSRNSPRGRETIYVLHENGLVVGNNLTRHPDGEIRLSNPYDDSFIREFSNVNLDVVTVMLNQASTSRPANEARRRNAALWS